MGSDPTSSGCELEFLILSGVMTSEGTPHGYENLYWGPGLHTGGSHPLPK